MRRARRALVGVLASALGITAWAATSQAAPSGGLVGPSMPANRWVGPDGTSSMHGDAGASDATPFAGPGADAQPAASVFLGSVCPTILAGRDRMPLAMCTEYLDRAPTVNLLDRTTLRPVARLHLSAGSLLGGVYAYLDSADRLVTVDGASGDVVRIAHDRGGPAGTWRLRIADRFPLGAALRRACGGQACDAVVSVSPGYDGRIWFATEKARVGYVEPRTGRIALRQLRIGEKVANSIANGPQGAAVTTDRALYLVSPTTNGGLRVAWRRAYARGPARKPGKLSHGSGATPTFFGPRRGAEWVAITDNAAPRENLLVLEAASGRLLCRQPLFRAGASGTENSPIGVGRSVIVASTYGYPYPAGADGPSQPASAPIAGGLTRVDVAPGGGCRTRWTTGLKSSAVPRYSRAEGVVYTVTRDGAQRYALARVSPADGRLLSSQPLGQGPLADTLQLVGTILPDRTLLQGTVTGFVAVRPQAD